MYIYGMCIGLIRLFVSIDVARISRQGVKF